MVMTILPDFAVVKNKANSRGTEASRCLAPLDMARGLPSHETRSHAGTSLRKNSMDMEPGLC